MKSVSFKVIGQDTNSDREDSIEIEVLPVAGPEFVRARSDPRRRCIRALVVDNLPIMLKLISMMLEEWSEVELIGTAIDGYHAARRVIELEPDLVLIDSRLPGINGLDVTRQIKARSQPPAVIILVGDDTPESREAAIAAGADGFVPKQHLASQLPAVIRELFPGITSKERQCEFLHLEMSGFREEITRESDKRADNTKAHPKHPKKHYVLRSDLK